MPNILKFLSVNSKIKQNLNSEKVSILLQILREKVKMTLLLRSKDLNSTMGRTVRPETPFRPKPLRLTLKRSR